MYLERCKMFPRFKQILKQIILFRNFENKYQIKKFIKLFLNLLIPGLKTNFVCISLRNQTILFDLFSLKYQVEDFTTITVKKELDPSPIKHQLTELSILDNAPELL